MTFALSRRSEARLVGVHPDLVAVVRRAIQVTTVDFGVLEGVRTIQRQRELVAKGASQTMNSRHLTGHAVDLFAWAPDKTGRPGVSWRPEHYNAIAQAMFDATGGQMVQTLPGGLTVGVAVEWGGHWRWFKDLTHFQLPWDAAIWDLRRDRRMP